jgi:hypothetical protein
MERIIGMEHQGGWVRDEQVKAERLRHRRAAGERCERSGVLRRCTPVAPGQERRCS